jgi:hypothetical protein
MRHRLTGPLVLLLLVAACGRPELADYYPLAAGASRTLRLHSCTIAGSDTAARESADIVELVRGEREVPGLGRVWVVETRRDTHQPAYAFFRRHDDAIIQLVPSTQEKPPTEISYLLFPLARGLRWYDTRAHAQVMEVTGLDTVDVPAGRFANCYQVLVTGIRRQWTMRQWFAPDVGLVKWEQQAFWFDPDSVPHELRRTAVLIEYVPPVDSGLGIFPPR